MTKGEIEDLKRLRERFHQLKHGFLRAESIDQRNREVAYGESRAFGKARNWLDDLAEEHGWWTPGEPTDV